jgi:hypothetical protein
MKRTLSNPVFLTCLVLAAGNQMLEKEFGVFLPIIHSYLDDLLCFPIVLTLGLAMYRAFIPNYKLDLLHMIPVLIAYSIYFELYLPSVSTSATSDPIDVLMYALGMAVFGYFINRNDAVGLEVN